MSYSSLIILSYIYIVSVWGYFFSSTIGAMIVLLLAFFLTFIYTRKHYSKREFTQLGIGLGFSVSLIMILKTLAVYDIFFASYRITNTVEHLNLMLSLCLVSWYFIQMYISEHKALLVITPLLAFSVSVVLEILQYVYREYFNLVAGKSHGLYNDSMIDLSVNFFGAIIFTYFILKVFGFKNIKNSLTQNS